MGKQINYWMGYQDFVKVAQVALDYDCMILKYVDGRIEYGNQINLVSENVHSYYFGCFNMNMELNSSVDLSRLRFQSQVIEAGFSCINHEKREIYRSRLYVGTGYFDENGYFIPRNDALTKMYNRLVREVKKIAPYTELTDRYISSRDVDYLQEKVWTHKEYITPEYLKLKQTESYKLKG